MADLDYVQYFADRVGGGGTELFASLAEVCILL